MLAESDRAVSAGHIVSNTMKAIHRFLCLTSGFWCLSAMAQQASPSQEEHFARVNALGDQGMGFSHERTTHHFHLFIDGGSIEIASKDAADTMSQNAVRDHLRMIAAKFSRGDFSIPMFIHDTIPPGVEKMKQLNGKISYLVQNTIGGAESRITTVGRG